MALSTTTLRGIASRFQARAGNEGGVPLTDPLVQFHVDLIDHVVDLRHFLCMGVGFQHEAVKPFPEFPGHEPVGDDEQFRGAEERELLISG